MQVIPKKESFKYLRSLFQENGEIGDDVTHCIGAGWSKWRLASRVMCDKKVSLKFKDRVVEMRMLRWICGHTGRDKIRNEDIQDKVGVASVVDKMRSEIETIRECGEA
ncbi:hypothetical protein H5410_044586 [Solanum commersonii]|uniref:Uncharacterized protein n=1 Tax=Solanum commersonii TaxID=4109 RepID=A0A9J5XBC9_SOLCO|nr:hypothetical protein H5410_044586 [Solanum commersonii]